MKRKHLLWLTFTLSVFNLYAQPDHDAAAIKKLYPDENGVILKWQEITTIRNTPSRLEITSENYNQTIHLSEKGLNSLFDKIPYDPHFNTIDKIEASTWLPVDGKYKEIRVKEFPDYEDVNGVHFYDSQRYKQILYPQVSYGCVTESRYTSTIIDPHTLGSSGFEFYYPALEIEYIYIVPEDVEIGIASFGDTTGIEYTRTTKGKNTIHRWFKKNAAAYKSHDFQMSDDRLRPHMFVYIKSYREGSANKVIQGSKEDLYRYNYSFIDGLDEPLSDKFSKVVDSIRTVSSSQEDLAKGVFYWVQDNIRYIAFEDGLGGFIPRKSNLVFERKYGDCKDMAWMIKSMLNHAGVDAHVCWVGTRSKGYTYDELPLPYCDNHMIAAYKKDNDYVFLDATSKHERFGLPSAGIQGKQTMIQIDKDHFDTPFIPVVPCEVNAIIDTVRITVESDGLLLKGRSLLNGYVKSELEYNLENTSSNNHKKMMSDVLSRGYNKSKLLSYSLEDAFNREKPLGVRYEQKLEDYARMAGDEIYLNLNMDKSMISQKPDTSDRTCDADFRYAYSVDGITELEVPANYSVNRIPDGILIDKDLYTISLQYKQIADKIVVHKIIQFRTIVIPNNRIKEWNSDLDKLAKAYQQVVVLKKKV